MDGVSRTAGVGPTITLGGRLLAVNTRVLRHYGLIEAEMLKQRGNPFDLIRQLGAALPEREGLMVVAVQKAFEQVMNWGYVTLPDMYHWMENTPHGRCYTVWLAVQHHDVTFEWVRDAFWDQYDDLRTSETDVTEGLAKAEGWSDEIFAAVMQASGQDEVGNSSGSPASSGDGEGVETSETDDSPGTPSTPG
jgi:hypothetical protein